MISRVPKTKHNAFISEKKKLHSDQKGILEKLKEISIYNPYLIYFKIKWNKIFQLLRVVAHRK